MPSPPDVQTGGTRISSMPFLAFVSNAADGTVSTFSIGDDGTLRRVAVSEIGPGCGSLVIDSARRLVYAGVKTDPPSIVSCRIQSDGSLRPMSRRDLEASANYLGLSPDGGSMVAASYSGGFGISMPVDGDGVVGPIVSRIDYPNIHSCAIAPDGHTAYFVSLGADLVAQCALDNHSLTPLDPPTAPAPGGSGPRHLALTRDGGHVYVMTEFSGEVLHYTRDGDGTLHLAGQAAAFAPDRGLGHSRFGADPTAEHLIWGADLHLSGDERFCWGSERTESTLATVPVDAGGTPHDATVFTSTELQPRGFAVSPDGRYLLCAGERSTTVSLFEIQHDGNLTLRDRAETGSGALWVRFLEPSDNDQSISSAVRLRAE
jgi:6-phosphogluconolactonase